MVCLSYASNTMHRKETETCVHSDSLYNSVQESRTFAHAHKTNDMCRHEFNCEHH